MGKAFHAPDGVDYFGALVGILELQRSKAPLLKIGSLGRGKLWENLSHAGRNRFF